MEYPLPLVVVAQLEPIMGYNPEELPKIIEALAYEMRFCQTLIDRLSITIKEHQKLYADSYENPAKSEYYRGMLVAFNATRNDYSGWLAKTKAHFEEVTGGSGIQDQAVRTPAADT